MKFLIQVPAAMVAALAYALLYHLKKKSLLPATLGAGLGWAIYLLLQSMGYTVPVALLLATAAMGLLGEIYARAFKSPAITFVVPMLIPMIPGGDLYYATFYLVQQDMDAFRQQGILLLKEAGAMAIGILAVACLMHLPWKLHVRRGKQPK